MKFKSFGDRLPFFLFCAALVVILSGLSFAYGALAHRNNLFPIPAAKRIVGEIRELLAPSDRLLTIEANSEQPEIENLLPDQVAPGLLMIAGIRQEGARDTFVRIINRQGEVLHEWLPIWDEIWPEVPDSIGMDRRPRGGAGMYLHGVDILPDASIVANFEHLSSFRMNICGEVEWKLDNLGHHSVHYSDQGALWVAAERYIPKGGETGYQNHAAPLRSWSIQQIGETGELLRDIEIIDVLRRNDLEGLLSLSTLSNDKTIVSGDTLHLNDVDIFPAGQPSEIFAPGDIMVSLRNINSIVVFDPETLKVKFVSTGHFLRHHDPDFLPGDIISVFDNRNLMPSRGPIPRASRIVEIDARTGAARVVLDGASEDGFFTSIMGVHQRLENGNILVTSSGQGQALEYLPDGRLAWRYNNRVAPSRNGRIFLTQLLSSEMNEDFFANLKSQCQ